ncbi:MAG TPA: Holliday junction resolvase-like protein [Gemmatimonadales bacterium]|jgi:predicted Holliday junction resolvase-like endonuclease|nr:Holliday junction resolvase-like protein [Gemmatimonadales bacterium]
MTTLITVVTTVVAVCALFLWWKARYTREIRRDAVRRSLAVVTGKVSEQLVPYWPQFPFVARDARFLGGPVDFVVFDGLSEGEGGIRRVVFVEVKTGEARLSPRERGIREAIERGAVEWMELRV